MASQAPLLDTFLEPLRIDVDKCHVLSQGFLQNFIHLAAESADQFLPTPISESILRPVADHGHGRHLSIDIGGTNLRVGFVELFGRDAAVPNQTNDIATNGSSTKSSSRIRRHLEKSWPIADHLKSDNADSLFLWIGKCIAEVVEEGCETFYLKGDKTLPMGVTFSFPTKQHSLSEATITSMGKGFAIPPNVDLGLSLQNGYDRSKKAHLPPIQVTAVANDSVSTLISFIFNYDTSLRHRATMGLILGTGSNATVPLKLSCLHPSKRPESVSLLPGENIDDVKIAVNTEWSINGTAPPMRDLGLITQWDDLLSSQNEIPGFQPLEYMTAGRYLGELGRIMLLDYMTDALGLPAETLPTRLLERHSLTTTFLSHFKPGQSPGLLCNLKEEFPESTGAPSFSWTEHLAVALYRIAKAIEIRAAGIMAAAVLALLTLAEELPSTNTLNGSSNVPQLGVGYTGGCIVHFQDYLVDCQDFIDQLMAKRFGDHAPAEVMLSPCHDGGITGAGILVAAASPITASDV